MNNTNLIKNIELEKELENKYFYTKNTKKTYARITPDYYNTFAFEDLQENINSRLLDFKKEYNIDFVVENKNNRDYQNMFENNFNTGDLKLEYTQDFVDYILDNADYDSKYKQKLKQDLEKVILGYEYKIDFEGNLIEYDCISDDLGEIQYKYDIWSDLFSYIETQAEDYGYTIIEQAARGYNQNERDEYTFIINTNDKKIIAEFEKVIKDIEYIFTVSDYNINIYEEIEYIFFDKNKKRI